MRLSSAFRFIRRLAFVAMVLPWFPGGMIGCAASGSGKAEKAAAESGRLGNRSKVTLDRLDQLTQSFADRYVVLISTACDKVRGGNPNPTERREAQILKINCATGAYDIATEVDPFTR